MNAQKYDWADIAKNTQFIKLQKKKTAFLLSLWVFGSLPYLLLILGAAYAPELYKTRVIGRMNIGYLFCMCQFFIMIAIALYYTYRANKDFDPLMKELFNELHQGGAQ